MQYLRLVTLSDVSVVIVLLVLLIVADFSLLYKLII